MVIPVVTGLGCTGSKIPESPRDRIQGVGWSFKAPSRGWWFIHRGKGNVTVLAGSSYYNVGVRPMVVALSKHCETAPQEPEGRTLGTATKWVGGRLGDLKAIQTDRSNEIVFVAKVLQDQCRWTFTCEGDARRAREVETICNTMVDTLEFH